MSTNLQVGIEKQRAVYDMPRPLLAQLAALHRLSIRDFASIFGISKSHAEEILNHKKFPSLELAIRIARYWECSTDELFGWRVDDDGARRPLLIALPGTNELVTLKASNPEMHPLAIVAVSAQMMRRKKEEAG